MTGSNHGDRPAGQYPRDPNPSSRPGQGSAQNPAPPPDHSSSWKTPNWQSPVPAPRTDMAARSPMRDGAEAPGDASRFSGEAPAGPSYGAETDPEVVYARRHRELELEAEEHRLREEERRTRAARTQLITTRLVNGVYFLVGALEVLLLLRLMLRLSGANIQNTFARFIYGLSDPFVAPFSTLFISPTADGARYIFDVNLIVAMVVYGLLGLLVGRLIRVFMGN